MALLARGRDLPSPPLQQRSAGAVDAALDLPELPPLVRGQLAQRRQQRLAAQSPSGFASHCSDEEGVGSLAGSSAQNQPVEETYQPQDRASAPGTSSPALDLPELPPRARGGLAARRQQRLADAYGSGEGRVLDLPELPPLDREQRTERRQQRRVSITEQRLQRQFAVPASPLEKLEQWQHGASARPFERRAEAGDRIRLAHRLRLPMLNLAQLQLASLPGLLHELLPGLKILHLDGNRLTSLAGLRHLDSLEMLSVDGNKLDALDSLPTLPQLATLRAYDNPFRATSNFDAARFPQLRNVHPSHQIDREQLHRLEFDTESVGWSEASDARMQDQEDFVSPIGEAARRWKGAMPDAQAETHAADFYRQLVPYGLHRRLQTDLDSRALLTLCAGLAFTGDGLSTERAPALLRDMRRDLDYLYASDDPKLLADCQEAADSAVNRCGDRVSYGRSKVHQAIALHRMIKSGCTAAEGFQHLDGLLKQAIVESKAFFIAAQREPGESISYYLALARAVAERGVELPEQTHENIFAKHHQPTPEEVTQTLALIEDRRNSPALHDIVTGNVGAQHFLRERFAEEYAAVLADRSLLQRSGDGDLQPHEADALQRALRRAFGDDRAHDADEQLHRAGELEMQWYRDKVTLIYERPELLAHEAGPGAASHAPAGA